MKYIKKYWTQIASLVIGLLIVFSFLQYSHIDHLNNRIETVNNNFKRLITKDSTIIKEIEFIQFKEDSYLKQIDRDTNLILWFVAIVFSISGLISFVSFNRRVEQIEESLEEKNKNHILELEKLKNELKNLKADFSFELQSIYKEKAKNHFEKDNDIYVFYTLLSIIELAKYYDNHKEKEHPIVKQILSTMLMDLSVLEKRISKFKSKPSVPENTFNIFSNSIKTFNSSKFELLVSKIHISLDIKTPSSTI